jgi:NAD(P) transhydrogenase subunit alpha
MRIAVPKEVIAEEKRVALVPESVAKLIKSGFEVLVEKDAGQAANYPDHLYEEAGAKIISDKASLFSDAEVMVKVNVPLSESGEIDEVEMLKEGCIYIGFLYTLRYPKIAEALAKKKITSFSMDAVPRIARAQSMDALSSMSSLAGYKAVLLAANALGKYFPLLITAAGTIPPAKGLILGAGVAGLQAIATARRLGANVEAFDVRPTVKEQVESLGGTFVEVDYGEETEDTGGYAKGLSQQAQQHQREKIHERIKLADFVITTALVPGKQAPILVTKQMVADMKPGSVIIDMAAETGGNCELSQPGKTVEVNGVTIKAPMNIPSMMAHHASQLYSKNILNLINHLSQGGQFRLDFSDAITSGCCITHEGQIKHEMTKSLLK